MPLNGTQMGDEIAAAVQALSITGQETNGVATSQLIWEAIGVAIVNHIKTNGVITTLSGAPNGEHSGIIS